MVTPICKGTTTDGNNLPTGSFIQLAFIFIQIAQPHTSIPAAYSLGNIGLISELP